MFHVEFSFIISHSQTKKNIENKFSYEDVLSYGI
jgi:hypothetical protein